MKFSNQNNNDFLSIIPLSYQYPYSKDSEYDANWLVLEITVKTNELHEILSDPSWLTWELNKIVDWFETLSRLNQPEDRILRFIEETIIFTFLGFSQGFINIEIELLHELKPKTWPKDDSFKLLFSLSQAQCSLIADKAKYYKNKFPKLIV